MVFITNTNVQNNVPIKLYEPIINKDGEKHIAIKSVNRVVGYYNIKTPARIFMLDTNPQNNMIIRRIDPGFLKKEVS